MDVQCCLCFLGRTAQKQLEFCVLLIKVDCADNGGHLSIRQASDPDIDAVTVCRVSACKVAIVHGINQKGVARMWRSLGAIDDQTGGRNHLVKTLPETAVLHHVRLLRWSIHLQRILIRLS